MFNLNDYIRKIHKMTFSELLGEKGKLCREWRFAIGPESAIVDKKLLLVDAEIIRHEV